MKQIIRFLSLVILFVVVPFVFGRVEAASLKFDKTTVSVTNGGTFQIAVTVDPGSDALSSVDAYVTYDGAYLKVNSVSAGTQFPTVSHDESTGGRVYIAGMVNDPTTSITSVGTVATITFQALKDGTTTLSFDCSTSKIIKNDINASDVMTCSQNNSSAVTIGASSGGTNPTSAPAANNNYSAPATELPQSGVFDNVANIAVPGLILLILGGVLKLVL